MSRNTTRIAGRGLGVIVALIAVAVIGLGAGVRWHAAMTRLLGAESNATVPRVAKPGPKQLWTCSMHPQVIREEPGLCPICHMELTPLN